LQHVAKFVKVVFFTHITVNGVQTVASTSSISLRAGFALDHIYYHGLKLAMHRPNGITIKHIPFFALTTLLLAPLDALHATDAPSQPNPYVSLFEQIFVRNETAAAEQTAFDKLCLADVAVRLEQRTGRTEYREKAAALLASALPEVARKPSDFHALRAIALAIQPLRQWGLIKPPDEQLLKTIAARTWKEFLANPDGSAQGDADHNIHIAEALSCAAFLNFFKDDKTLDSAPIRARLERYWSKIKATGDLNEDASNYTGLGIVHCIELAQILGHEEDLRVPGFRRMFERQRDLFSTTGVLPEFGDGFFHLDRDAFDFLYLCEYAAKVFDDPTFLTVARRLYDPVTFAKAPTDEWCRATALLGLALSTRDPAPLPAASLVNYRATRVTSKPVVDKLILRNGIEPGSAMVMMDLYASGSHAHPFKGPSVAYYEVDGVPLFHNLGRHRTRSPITGNSFWALEEGCAFPGVWKPGEWFTMSIPVEMLPHDADGALMVGDRLTLRNFENRGTRRLWFDNLRLEGNAGTKLLDGFESAKTWHRNITSAKGINVVTSPEHTQGAASQSLNWCVLKGGAYARMLADDHKFTFKPGEFDTLKLDVKYEGIRPYLHLRDLCEQIDLGDHVLPYTVGSARTEQHGRDAFGEVVFSRYVADDARLTRRIVLTAEGCLIIRDQWSAGKSQPKWTAGQLWQFYAMKEQGKDWFCSEDDGAFNVPDGQGSTKPVTRRMLVKFATDASTETFVEQINQSYLAPNPKKRPQDKFFTTGSKRVVSAGEQASFTLVVVPHEPTQDAKSIADGIRFNEQPDGVEVALSQPVASGLVRVLLRRDGRWEIVRSP
jgi:hypothetical protein